jgi:hypothetical protein
MTKENIDAYRQGQIDALDMLIDNINQEVGFYLDDHKYRAAGVLLDVLEIIEDQKKHC